MRPTWYLGGMTATDSRELDLQLDFLNEGSFTAELYLDDPARGPTSVNRSKYTVSPSDMLRVVMPRAGGFAARLVRIVQ